MIRFSAPCRAALPGPGNRVFVRPMSPANATDPGRRPAAEIPLALAYGILPMVTALSGLGWLPEPEPPDMAWLVLACFGLVASLRRPAPGAPARRGFVFLAVLLLLAMAGLVLYRADLMARLAPALPYIKECGPLAYLLFGVLWALTFGMADRRAFQKYGALLGLLCLLDMVAELVMYRTVPTVRLIGNADVVAGLLLVALCAGLRPGENQGGVIEPDQGRPWWRMLIMLGVPACLSHTALFAAAWVILCFGRGKLRFRTLYAMACLAVLAGSLLLPATISDAIRYTDYWLWLEAVRLFTETPALLLTGFPVGDPLPVQFPVGMGAIWEAATGAPAIFGAFLSQVPSFWLRLILAWGAGVPLVLLATMFALLLRRLTRLGAGLSAALFAQGMATPPALRPGHRRLRDPGLCPGTGTGPTGQRAPRIRARQLRSPSPRPGEGVGPPPPVAPEKSCPYSKKPPPSWSPAPKGCPNISRANWPPSASTRAPWTLAWKSAPPWPTACA